MLFARGIASRAMIGLRLERQRTALEPVGRSSQGIAASRGLAVVLLHERRHEVVVLDLDETAFGVGPDLGRRARGLRSSSSSCHVLWSCGTDARSDFVYGWSGLPNTRSVRAHLDDAAASQDDRPVADVVAEREVVGDEEDPEPACLQRRRAG